MSEIPLRCTLYHSPERGSAGQTNAQSGRHFAALTNLITKVEHYRASFNTSRPLDSSYLFNLAPMTSCLPQDFLEAQLRMELRQ
ncbi:hypothetical protein PoB_004754500 [Plakobranchus ocellatus]|uniref:Uncharacterized protein n=1 Tax=Plakobranchus ocellatus TaxID=259542 RepID=A0AAV4BKJ3_9GAST|nr:hypothetical protein PoB_004754500 [Plakobranchus ocellatus]